MNEFNGIEMFKRAYNIYNKLLNDIAKKNDLTLNQLKILMFLSNNNENNLSKNIVDGVGATKSHISMSVSELERKAYIEKIQDENDKKKYHLQLTKKSFDIVEYGKIVQKKVKDIMFEGIEDKELNVLIDVSKKIKENLEKYNNLGG